MGKMGEILVTTSTCPISAGDPQPRFVLDLAISLGPHFDRVHLLAPGAPNAPEKEEIAGVLVHRFQYAWPASLQQLCYRQGIMQNIRANPLLLALLPGFIAAQIGALRRICVEFPIELVNSHWFVFQGLIAAAVCKRMGIRHVTHSHGADVYLLQKVGCGIGRGLARFVAKRSDKIICESTYVREQLDLLLGYPSQADVSCMGVDIGRLRGSEVHGSTVEDREADNNLKHKGHEEHKVTKERNPDENLEAKEPESKFRVQGSEIRGQRSEVRSQPEKLKSTTVEQLNREPLQPSSSKFQVSSFKFHPSSSPSLLFVGRLVEKKGVEYLIRAMPLIRAARPDVCLRIVGGGALERQLRELTTSLGLMGKGVEFIGPLQHDRVAELLAEARVVVLPSIIDSHGEADGMPTVLLEAMAARRLVVASRVDGIPDVLKDGENGWLCEPRNSEDLAAKILKALAYDGAAVPDAAYKTAEYYDWPVLGARYAGIMRDSH